MSLFTPAKLLCCKWVDLSQRLLPLPWLYGISISPGPRSFPIPSLGVEVFIVSSFPQGESIPTQHDKTRACCLFSSNLSLDCFRGEVLGRSSVPFQWQHLLSPSGLPLVVPMSTDRCLERVGMNAVCPH
jgi:hypothetical protein